MVLEKTLASPLNCREIKSVNPKGNQPWLFTGRTDAETHTLDTWCKEPTHWKRLWWFKDWRQKEKRVAEYEVVRQHYWLSDMNFNKLWEIVKDREAWYTAVQGITKSWSQLSDWTTTKEFTLTGSKLQQSLKTLSVSQIILDNETLLIFPPHLLNHIY